MGALEAAVRDVMGAFDRQEYGGILRLAMPDAQGVDEIARRWLRDADEVEAYFKQLEGAVDDVSSTLSDATKNARGPSCHTNTEWYEFEIARGRPGRITRSCRSDPPGTPPSSPRSPPAPCTY